MDGWGIPGPNPLRGYSSALGHSTGSLGGFRWPRQIPLIQTMRRAAGFCASPTNQEPAPIAADCNAILRPADGPLQASAA
jgi:hypothetical protein